MFDKKQLKRLKPLLIFLVVFTLIFMAFAATLLYTFPFVAGFVLALATQPIIRWLKKRLRCRPWLAATLSTIFVYIVLFGILTLLGMWLAHEITALVDRLATGNLNQYTKPLEGIIAQLGAYFNKIDANFIEENQQQLLDIVKSSSSVISTVLKTALDFLTSLPAIFTMFIVMIFSTYFFSKDMRAIKDSMMSLLTKSSVGNIRMASHHGASISGRYIGSYLLVYFLTFLETLIAFSILGIPYPLTLSIITGIADVLPVLGPGTIYIPLAVIYICLGQWGIGVILLVAWLVITGIRQVVEPKLVSSTINIHPLFILAAIYFSLIAGNFWILIYTSLLLLLYQIFTKRGVLPTVFPQKPEPEPPPAPPPDEPLPAE